MDSLWPLQCIQYLGNSHGFHFHLHGNSLLSLWNNTTKASTYLLPFFLHNGVRVSLTHSVLTDSNSSVVYFT